MKLFADRMFFRTVSSLFHSLGLVGNLRGGINSWGCFKEDCWIKLHTSKVHNFFDIDNSILVAGSIYFGSWLMCLWQKNMMDGTIQIPFYIFWGKYKLFNRINDNFVHSLSHHLNVFKCSSQHLSLCDSIMLMCLFICLSSVFFIYK